MLEVKSVTRMFGQKAAVDRASFRIEGAAFVGIIGRSEARKSTFLRMMNRLVDASSGEILVDGRNVLALRGREARAWQSQCAMIFQQFNLVPRMDVASNVLHGILNRRSSLRTMFNLWPRADILRALEILDRLTGAIVGGGIGLLLTQAIITQKDWEEVAYYNRVCDRMIDVSRFRPEVAA